MCQAEDFCKYEFCSDPQQKPEEASHSPANKPPLASRIHVIEPPLQSACDMLVTGSEFIVFNTVSRNLELQDAGGTVDNISLCPSASKLQHSFKDYVIYLPLTI